MGILLHAVTDPIARPKSFIKVDASIKVAEKEVKDQIVGSHPRVLPEKGCAAR